MHSGDSRGRPRAATAVRWKRGSANARGAYYLRPGELERWLCGPRSPALSLDDLASVFGLWFDSPADAAADRLLRRLRFTIAVLRDAFPDDAEARRWVRSPIPGLGARRPLDRKSVV